MLTIDNVEAMATGPDVATSSEQTGMPDLTLCTPAEFVDSGHPRVVEFARSAARGAGSATERAALLFTAVRDGIRYDPYSIQADRDAYLASSVAGMTASWCVPKAVLLTAAARAQGIPARLRFADVRNHLSSPKLLRQMGTDLFVYHGYTELHLNGRWWKASPTFNRELCARFGVPPLEFDGTADALLHAHDGAGRRHMEYVRDHGWYRDLPFEDIMAALRNAYGRIDLADAGDDAAFTA